MSNSNDTKSEKKSILTHDKLMSIPDEEFRTLITDWNIDKYVKSSKTKEKNTTTSHQSKGSSGSSLSVISKGIGKEQMERIWYRFYDCIQRQDAVTAENTLRDVVANNHDNHANLILHVMRGMYYYLLSLQGDGTKVNEFMKESRIAFVLYEEEMDFDQSVDMHVSMSIYWLNSIRFLFDEDSKKAFWCLKNLITIRIQIIRETRTKTDNVDILELLKTWYELSNDSDGLKELQGLLKQLNAPFPTEPEHGHDAIYNQSQPFLDMFIDAVNEHSKILQRQNEDPNTVTLEDVIVLVGRLADKLEKFAEERGKDILDAKVFRFYSLSRTYLQFCQNENADINYKLAFHTIRSGPIFDGIVYLFQQFEIQYHIIRKNYEDAKRLFKHYIEKFTDRFKTVRMQDMQIIDILFEKISTIPDIDKTYLENCEAKIEQLKQNAVDRM